MIWDLKMQRSHFYLKEYLVTNESFFIFFLGGAQEWSQSWWFISLMIGRFYGLSHYMYIFQLLALNFSELH